MKIVYIAGPYTHGDVAVNVRNAMDAGMGIIKAGHAPFIPHLSHFLHMRDPQPYHVWTNMDLAFVRLSDAVLRLIGHSPGADQEIALAQSLNIPVFYDEDTLIDFLQK